MRAGRAARTGERITIHPVLSFEGRVEVGFEFDGRTLKGFAGEPIAAALAANGIRVYRRTEKLNRPRGFFCAVGKCSSCLMEVDGRPNVMVCMEPLRSGMKVRRQEGRGSVQMAGGERHGNGDTKTQRHREAPREKTAERGQEPRPEIG